MSGRDPPPAKKARRPSPTHWPDVVIHAVTELGQHGADGLVTILLFVVLLVATRLGVGPCITLPGMVLCGGFYFLLRTAERQHAVRLADLSLKTEAARVSAITDSYRAQTANREQPGLPFGSRSDG